MINASDLKMVGMGTSTSSKMIKALFDKEGDSLLRKFGEFRENSQWIAVNREGLRHKFPNKYIAVSDRKVVESNKNLTNLLKTIKQEYGQAQEVAVDYISKDRVKLLL